MIHREVNEQSILSSTTAKTLNVGMCRYLTVSDKGTPRSRRGLKMLKKKIVDTRPRLDRHTSESVAID